MDSSADHPGSESVEPAHDTSATAPAGEAPKVPQPHSEALQASESVKTEAVSELVKAEAPAPVSEPVKAEAEEITSHPVKAEAAPEIYEPVKAEAAKEVGAEAVKKRIEPT